MEEDDAWSVTSTRMLIEFSSRFISVLATCKIIGNSALFLASIQTESETIQVLNNFAELPAVIIS